MGLRQHGAREIFGIPGDFAIPIFKGIEASRILPLYTLSHEPALGFAAEAAARIHGGLGVVVVTYGPGALNLINPVANAFMERSPVVVISAAPSAAEIHSGFVVHHQARTPDSQLAIYREVTCDQARLDDVARAPELIARVLRSAREHSQPVFLEIPRDLALLPSAPVEPLPARLSNVAAVEECATEILDRLRAAKHPMLLAGVEVRRYGLARKVAELALRLGLPMATTFMGRGLFAGVDAKVVGTYLGLAGDPGVSAMVESSDALLMLGPVFSDTNFGVSAKKLDLRSAILAARREVRVGHHVYHDIVLAELLDSLLVRSPVAARSQPIAEELTEYPHGLPADDAPIRPVDVACAVNDLLRLRGSFPITADMGDCLFAAMSIEHTALLASACYATMGFSIPAAFGVQVASGERPLVLVGDGAFQMTGMELGNCSRYGWDPIVLVLNNRSWGMLGAFDADVGFTGLSDLNYAELAAPLGGHGKRVRTRRELGAALVLAAETRGAFYLIDIELEPGAISPALEQYVRAFERRRQSPTPAR